MKVKRNTLLLLACLVWSAAGFNILRIGLLAYPAYLSVWNTMLSILVFAVFQQYVFGKLVCLDGTDRILVHAPGKCPGQIRQMKQTGPARPKGHGRGVK